MKRRWGTIVTIGVVAVISAGAVLAIANGGRDEGSGAHSSSGATAARDEGSAATAGGAASGLGGLPTPELHAQVVKTATLELEVGRRRTQPTVEDVLDAVGLVRGFVESTDQSGGRARLTIRVPAEQFDVTLDRLTELGRKRSVEVHGQDVTGAVTDLDARLRNLRAQEGVLLELMRKATTIGDSIAVQQQLSQIQQQIEQLDGQRRALADQTTWASIVVSIAPLGAPATPAEASSTTLAGAFEDGVDAALAVTGGTLIVLGALLPILVIGGAGVLVWRVVARRQRRSQPAAT